MKKTLFFVSGNTIGGHEYQCKELILLASKYAKVTVVFNTVQQENAFHLDKSLFITKVVNFYSGKKAPIELMLGVINFFRFFNLVRKYDQIVVSAGTIESSCGMFFLSCLTESVLYVPMFVDRVILWDNKLGSIYNSLLYFFLLPFSKIITITDAQAASFKLINKTFVMPNRVLMKEKDVSNASNKSKDPILYFVGRIDNQQKRIIELINWLDSDKNPYKEFQIVGDGPDLPSVRMIAQQTRYIHVKFLGWLSREQQDGIFGKHDILILNSAYEGDPLVIREANERNSIVIARDIVGVQDSTYCENRYSTKDELQKLLQHAANNRLKVFKNISLAEIDNIRSNVGRTIFL